VPDFEELVLPVDEDVPLEPVFEPSLILEESPRPFEPDPLEELDRSATFNILPFSRVTGKVFA
jgi:hypothetical protein